MLLTSKILTTLLTTLTLGTTLKSETDSYYGEPIQEKQKFETTDGLITNTVVDQRDNVWVATTNGIMLKKSGDKLFTEWNPTGLTFGTIKGDVKIIKAVDSSKVYFFMTMNGITGTYPDAGNKIWVTDANDPSSVTTLSTSGTIKNISAIYANDKHVLIGGKTTTDQTELFEYVLDTNQITKYGNFNFTTAPASSRINAIYQGNGNWFSDRVVILVSGISGASVNVGDDYMRTVGTGDATTTEYSENVDKTIYTKIWKYASMTFNYYDSINVININGQDKLIASGGTFATTYSSSAFMELDYSSVPAGNFNLSYWRINGTMYNSYVKSFVFSGNAFWSFVGRPTSSESISDRARVVNWTDKPKDAAGITKDRPLGSFDSYKSRTDVDFPYAVDSLMDEIPTNLTRLLLPNFAGDSYENIYFGVYDTMFFVGQEPIPEPDNAGNVELSGGAIAGIVIGSVVAGAGLGIGGYYGFKKLNKFSKKLN